MRINESADDAPSTSANYAPYEQKSANDLLFGYSEQILAPWLKKRYKLSIDGLHEEILDMYHWLRPSQVETKLRYRVYERVKKAIQDHWKDYDIKISVFGSLRTNLFLPTSDIDVLVECPAWENVATYLHKTAEVLKSSGMAENISVYADAFVPIVKMVDKDTLVSIDISFNTVQGVRAADYIEKVKQEFPVVEPLILILKQFLIQRNLNQTFLGGLSSYGLILMLISFLQIYAMPVRGKSFYDDGVNLGELLMRFFEVYAQEFNYVAVGISVEDCKYREKPPSMDFSGPVLSLEDPLLRSNEVGRSTYNFALVQSAFAQALQVLKGVFVRDRRRNAAFNEILYKSGSTLALIMPFTSQQVEYRCWLKVRAESRGLSMKKIEKTDKIKVPVLITNTCVAPYIDMDSVSWNQFQLPVKTSRPLSIVHPTDAKPSDGKEASKSDSGKGEDKQPVVPVKEMEQLSIEKENGDKQSKKQASPRKEDSPRKDGSRARKFTESYTYSSAVYRNSKKQTASKSERASASQSAGSYSKKSDTESLSGARSSGSESRKLERRPDQEYYNSAARHKHSGAKSSSSHNNNNPPAKPPYSSDADSEQDNSGFTVVRRR